MKVLLAIIIIAVVVAAVALIRKRKPVEQVDRLTKTDPAPVANPVRTTYSDSISTIKRPTPVTEPKPTSSSYTAPVQDNTATNTALWAGTFAGIDDDSSSRHHSSTTHHDSTPSHSSSSYDHGSSHSSSSHDSGSSSSYDSGSSSSSDSGSSSSFDSGSSSF
jgi:uncharacterized membrane protein YgcG